MRELSIHCGNDPELIGIYTDCENANSDGAGAGAKMQGQSSTINRPVVLLLNSGLLPNVGPYRLYVRLARHFATLGFNTYRFDISGIGDSARSSNPLDRSEQQIRDVEIVMNHLEEKLKCDSFIVMGICTGADNAHRAMMADRRIVGVVAIDGYYYKTPRYHANRLFKELLPKALQLRTLLNRLIGVRQNIFNSIEPNLDAEQNPVTVPYRWELPEKMKTESDFKEIIDRDANMLCVFTANWPYNYTEQLADAFPSLEFGENIRVQYLKNAAHLFPIAEDRAYLTDAISDWLLDRF